MNVLQLCRIPVMPPQNGAMIRVRRTAEKFVELGDLWFAAPPTDVGSAESFERIDLDTRYLTNDLVRNDAWLGLFTLSEFHPLVRATTDAVVKCVTGPDATFDVVVPEFPQVMPAGAEIADRHGARLLLNKHNATYEILDEFLASRPVPDAVRRRAVANLRSFERRFVAAADLTVFQSEVDREQFADVTGASTAVIPNGCDYERIRGGGDPEAVARNVGIDPDAFVCTFVGSYEYGPNRAAARRIATDLAPALPEVEFLLVGRDPPATDRANVIAPGFVDDLPGALALADVGLCPLTAGSGTKLKMLDYFAAGLPVVSTPVGVQGLPVTDGEDVLVHESMDGFVAAIERLTADPARQRELAANAREIARAHSWERLLAEYENVFDQLLAAPV